MIELLCFILAVLASPFKSNTRLEAENAALRHQLIVLRRKVKGRAHLTNNDRWFFIQMYRWFPSILVVLVIIRTETLVHWHRAGFRRGVDHVGPMDQEGAGRLHTKAGRYAGDEHTPSAKIDPHQHIIGGGCRLEAIGHDKLLHRLWAQLSPWRQTIVCQPLLA